MGYLSHKKLCGCLKTRFVDEHGDTLVEYDVCAEHYQLDPAGHDKLIAQAAQNSYTTALTCGERWRNLQNSRKISSCLTPR